MTKPFASTGAWPVADAGRRMTRREIEALERETPSTFYNTLATGRRFVGLAEFSQRAADEASEPEVKAFFTALAAAERAGDQVAAFRLLHEFGCELDAALKVETVTNA